MLGRVQESMSAQLVNLATNEKLKEPDWAKNIEICEEASYSPEKSKDVIKAIKKRLSSKNQNSQLLAVVLLEMLMNNCGEHIHRLVIEKGVLQMLVKIVKKKSDLPVREKIFLLLDATQTAVGGASGKFPQYYAAYYELVHARVQFSGRTTVPASTLLAQIQDNDLPMEAAVPQKPDIVPQPNSKNVPDSSIIQKATNVMEVLREVLDAIDPLCPEGATDEFTLDLVEQCSFHKQRVMHLVMTSRDEKLVSQAIELNDQLQKCSQSMMHSSHFLIHAVLLSIMKKQKKKRKLIDYFEDPEKGRPVHMLGGKIKLNVHHPVHQVPSHLRGHATGWSQREPFTPKNRTSRTSTTSSAGCNPSTTSQTQGEGAVFREKQVGSVKVGQMLGSLSLHSRNGSSSRSGSTEFSE